MARRSKRASLQGLTASDFFHVNKRGQRTFKPGWDAKLASAIRRCQDGIQDRHDEALLLGGILQDSKVAESAYFQGILGEGTLNLAVAERAETDSAS